MSLDKPRKLSASYEDLLASHYGAGRDPFDQLAVLDERIARHYGTPWTRERAPARSRRVRSARSGGGEIAGRRTACGAGEEYCVPEVAPLEEYVVPPRSPLAPVTGGAPPASRGLSADVSPDEEYAIDVLAPLGNAVPPRSLEVAPAPPAASAAQPAPAQPSAAPSPAAAAASSKARTTDDEFMDDMKSILAGKKVYDPVSGRTVDKERLAGGAPMGGPQPVSAPEPSQSQAIFERIKRSMDQANAFDLGTVELNRRFSEFDELADVKQRAALRGTKAPETSARPAPRAGGTAEFLQDLDAIHRERSVAQSVQRGADGLSRPLYDMGEHVLVAGDLYVDRLRLGTNPGVLFSYGEIVAMADLYGSVEEMRDAPVPELQKIKSLIDRSASYHAGGGKKDESLKVSDDMWEAATRGRYLTLAEENYSHFSPNELFKEATFSRNERADHRSAWEHHHRWALTEAKRAMEDDQKRQECSFAEWPLIVNAFADHFLTDAFSAGHQIAKDEIMARFRATFYSGGTLNAQGEQFFARVANLAWRDEVKTKFSALETYEPLLLGWSLRIDTEKAFRALLVKAANEQPDQIANTVVLALHDKLNKEGIEVTNEAGDAPWRLSGDGSLNPKTLAIVRRAVQQSAANVIDPSLASGPIDEKAFFRRVWKHAPTPTPGGKARLLKLADTYSRPDSTELAGAAADIITRKVDTLIKKLIELKKLKPA